MNPTSASALRSLGMYLVTGDPNRPTIMEAIPYLKRAAALDPNAYQGKAFHLLGSAYLKLGNADKALEYLNRAQAIHDSMHRRELIELIEKGELP